MAWYDPGKQVVCVDDEWRDNNWLNYECPLEVGRVYTVASISGEGGQYRGKRDHLSVFLAEAENPYGLGFALKRFRPVQRHNRSTETGMQIIRDIAARKREPEGIEA